MNEEFHERFSYQLSDLRVWCYHVQHAVEGKEQSHFGYDH